jgi:hypothetical protein
MTYPAVIFWLLIAWSVSASRSTVLVLLLASGPFASLALLPPGIVGVSILPSSMFAVVLILKVLVPHLLPLSPKLLTALQLRHLGFLVLYLLVGTIVTAFMPKLFADQVIVIPMKASSAADLLRPTLQNITQFAYVTLSVAMAIAVTLMVDGPSFTKKLLLGMLAGGIVCIVTGVIDLVASSTGMGSLLEPFRNAGYALLTTGDVAGQKRVVGFTPEASAYGSMCVGAASILLLRHLFAEGLQRILATMIGIGLLGMALLSTSSTAYLGLAVFGLVYLANWIRRAASTSPLSQHGLLGELFIGLGAIAAVLFVLIARANLFDPLLNLVNEVIFNKPLSQSFYERSLWNTMAWETVASTWGLGVGFGSARTSNWFAAIVSSAGLIGTAFLAIFLVQIFAKRPRCRAWWSDEVLAGLKLSLIPVLAMSGVAGAGADFGGMGLVFGAITGLAAFGAGHGSVGHAAEHVPKPPRLRTHREIRSPVIGRAAFTVRRQDSEPDRPAPRPSYP